MEDFGITFIFTFLLIYMFGFFYSLSGHSYYYPNKKYKTWAQKFWKRDFWLSLLWPVKIIPAVVKSILGISKIILCGIYLFFNQPQLCNRICDLLTTYMDLVDDVQEGKYALHKKRK